MRAKNVISWDSPWRIILFSNKKTLHLGSPETTITINMSYGSSSIGKWDTLIDWEGGGRFSCAGK